MLEGSVRLMSEQFGQIRSLMLRAKRAAAKAAASSGAVRNDFLNNLARLAQLGAPEIKQANDLDMEEGRKSGLGEAILDRLLLSGARISSLVHGLADCAALPDPLGEVESLKVLKSGLKVGRRRVSLGLIGFICEARPGAVVEAAAMAVKSGNALIAKPGRDSSRTSLVLGRIIHNALIESKLSPDTVTVNPSFSQEELVFILGQSDILDLVIPRGGESLIRFVDEHSRVPVLRHYKGVNHLFVDEGADLGMALDLTENGKCDRPSTCNALECLLVHQAAAAAFIPKMAEALDANGVTVLGDPESAALSPLIGKAEEGDYGREFLDLILAVKVVSGLTEALEHIERYGSNHTEAICTRSLDSAQKFLSLVDASCVLVNASTRLNDGGCLGLGAEIGISTSKIHAYGPMGLKELTTTKFVVIGDGHLR
ncbi:MAG: glutamate-5-semialdehyde dehydrogenase [Deltaproteobacteria bacterium]|jgi:glutamate-5-semialdehyde dehydrogenase|nr:glutamate-5-semialdehyde dehydrogenase [Deltaproteobacteria bacterium]